MNQNDYYYTESNVCIECPDPVMMLETNSSYGVSTGQDMPSLNTNVINSNTTVSHSSTLEYNDIHDDLLTQHTVTQDPDKSTNVKLTGVDGVFSEDNNNSIYGVINQPRCNDPISPEDDNNNSSKYGVINQPRHNDPIYPEGHNNSKYGVINQP